jgi:hypothetical protein
MRKRIYIAGAISPTSKNRHPVLEYCGNVASFLATGTALYRRGFAPYIPALDMLIAIWGWGNFKPEDFYETSLAYLAAADAMLVLPDYENSIGTKKELEYAKEHAIPIFYDVDDLIEYFKGEETNDD